MRFRSESFGGGLRYWTSVLELVDMGSPLLEQGAVVLDARAHLEPAEPPLPLGARA